LIGGYWLIQTKAGKSLLYGNFMTILIRINNDDDTFVINDTYFKTIIDKARVARLATVDTECKPRLIPFVFDNDCYFIPIDEKTNRSRPEKLKRAKNIQQNPNVALSIDEYNEDWTKLYFIMIQ
jgi:nitroimidazol reductase NimA-like FMN-containing flavoprotein (pyridoxamine 5'-phosphate oxidase superfamily)